MSEKIRTRRLIIRELEASDAEGFYQLNSDPEVLRYTGDVPFESIYAAWVFLENYPEYRENGYGRWAVVLKKTGEFIGWCGLKLNEEGYTDLGFRFFKKYWGQGYAKEAAQAAVLYGFDVLNLEEIIGRAAVQNKAAIRVLEKAGMKFWKSDHCPGLGKAAYYKLIRKDANRKEHDRFYYEYVVH